MISPSQQPRAAGPQLFNGIQLAFFYESLIGFIGIFNSVLPVLAFRVEELRGLINSRRAATTEGSGHKAHRLTDFEFMLVHRALRHVEGIAAPPCRWNRATSIVCFMGITTTTKWSRGAISTGSISWSMALPVSAAHRGLTPQR